MVYVWIVSNTLHKYLVMAGAVYAASLAVWVRILPAPVRVCCHVGRFPAFTEPFVGSEVPARCLSLGWHPEPCCNGRSLLFLSLLNS